MHGKESPGQSSDFYRRRARDYSEVAHAFRQSVYRQSSHSSIVDDWSLMSLALKRSCGSRCLDAGCGPGARDVFELWRRGIDVHGIDRSPEAVLVARQVHPEIAERVSVHDLTHPLPFENASFDLVLCNAVIQHIPREDVFAVTLPEFARVLVLNGVLQLMFKCGAGTLTLFDPDYGESRTFLLYEEEALIDRLAELQLQLIEPSSPTEPGGCLYFTDSKGARHCTIHVRKMST